MTKQELKNHLIGWQGAAPATRARLLHACCSGISLRSILSNSVTALILGAFIITDTRNPIHGIWLVLALLGGLLPRLYAARLRREGDFTRGTERKALTLVGLNAVYGVIWGAGPLLMLPHVSGTDTGLLLLLIIFGTVMGPYAAMPGILYARMVTTGIPTLLAIALYTNLELTIAALVLAAWLVLRTDVWRGYHRVLRRQLELLDTLENQRQELHEANRAKQRANDSLKIMAETDPLTGVANRRQFLAMIDDLQSPASVILFDVDHFKEVNDRHGHHAGDRLLIDLTELVSQSLRKEDLLARLGGDEFAVILPGVGSQGALSIAQRMRQSVEQHVIENNDDRIRTTVSLGVATLGSGGRLRTSAELMQEADLALYAAKRAGRNRVARGPAPVEPVGTISD